LPEGGRVWASHFPMREGQWEGEQLREQGPESEQGRGREPGQGIEEEEQELVEEQELELGLV